MFHMITIAQVGHDTIINVSDRAEPIRTFNYPVLQQEDLYNIRESDLKSLFSKLTGADAQYETLPNLVEQVWAALETDQGQNQPEKQNQPAQGRGNEVSNGHGEGADHGGPEEQQSPAYAGRKVSPTDEKKETGGGQRGKGGPVELIKGYMTEHPGAPRKEVIDWAVSQGVNKSTAATQYNRWRHALGQADNGGEQGGGK